MKDKLWKFFSKIIDKVTKRECADCKYINSIFCGRLDKKGEKCRKSIFPVGFERK